MKSKNKKKLLKSIILFVFLIFLLLLIIKVIKINEANKPAVKNGSTDENIVEVSPIYEKEEKKEIYPKKSYEFIMKYNKIGKLNLNDMYKKIYMLKVEIQRIFSETKNLNNSQLESYYKKNETKLNEIISFSNEENFLKFIKKIQEIKEIKFNYAEFNLENFEDIVKDYIKCELNFYYNENEKISFNMFLSKYELERNEEKYIFRVNF